MATRRKSTKARGGSRAAGRRKGGRAAGARARRRSGASRQAPGRAAARELRAQQEGERAVGEAPARTGSRTTTDEARAITRAGEAASIGTAERPASEEGAGGSAARDRDAAELARRIEATVGAAADTLRTGPESAAEQLGAHRDHVEEAARERDAPQGLPGAAQLGLELAVGAFRLARALATAPFRIGLALLRRGDAIA